MEWSADWELRVRMAAVLVLLVALLVGAVHLALLAAVPILELVGVRVLVGVGSDGTVGLAVTTGLVVVAVVAELLVSQVLTGPDRSLGSATGGASSRALRGRATRLSRQVDVPVPDVTVSCSTTPIAYTTGVTARGATIVVTTGLLDLLDDDELDAVLAHELAHVKNNDAMVMTAASLVEVLAHRVLSLYSLDGNDAGAESGWHYGDESLDGLADRGVLSTIRRDAVILADLVYTILVRQSAVLLVYVLSPVLYPITWVLWATGRILTRILSRYRELAADRGAVVITGSPAALASALTKLDRSVGAASAVDLRSRERAQRSFFVVPVPDAGPDHIDFDGYGNGPLSLVVDLLLAPFRALDRLTAAVDVDAHPPTEKRIARLRAFDAELESR